MVAFCGRLIYFQVALSLSANEKVRSHLSPRRQFISFLAQIHISREIIFLGQAFVNSKKLPD